MNPSHIASSDSAKPEGAAASGATVPGQWRVGTLTYTRSSLVATFLWLLLGDFSWSLKERAVIPMGQLLLRDLQASDLFIALMVGSVPAGLAMLLGPIIGTRSDRHRSRYGRRIPYLLIPAPIIGLSLIGLGFTQPLGNALHALLGMEALSPRACMLMVFALLWTTFEVSSVCANAVFAGLINDVVPKNLVGRFYGWFRAVSLLAGIGFTFYALALASSHQIMIFSVIGALYMFTMWLMCVKVKEGQYPPPPPLPEVSTPLVQRWSGGLRRYLTECFSHRFYVLVFLAMALGLVSATPVNTFSLFYAQSLGLSLGEYGKLLAITYTISLMMAIPTGWLADRLHPLRVGLIAIVAYAVTMTLGSLLVSSAASFSWVFVLHGVFAGAYITGTAAMGQYLFPALRFAQIQSAMNVVFGLTTMIVPPIMGWVLDMSHRNFRLSLVFSAGLAWACALVFLMLMPGFRRLGGFRDYRAPD